MKKVVGASAAIFVAAFAIIGMSVFRGEPAPTFPRFHEEAAQAGVAHVYDGEFEHFVGGGVASLDCNDDGFPELYFAGGSREAALYANRSTLGGALSFERLASPITDLTAATGAYPLDVDGDGLLDLVVLRRGGNAILRGLGNCAFEDVTASLGLVPSDQWT
ncbi:MAG: FG-GAP repeat domain-containing protein, partial [Actinomycetota bacterium]